MGTKNAVAKRKNNDLKEFGRLTSAELATRLKLEAAIDKGLHTFVEVGNHLKQIRDEKLHRDKWNTFEGYCEDRFGFGRSYAHRLIEASDTVEKVKMLPIGNKIEIKTESQARALSSVPIEQWEDVVDTVVADSKKSGKPVTAAAITAAADEKKPRPAKPKPKSPASLTSLRSACIKQMEAAMRAVDELHRGSPNKEQHALIKEHFQDCYTIIREWNKK